MTMLADEQQEIQKRAHNLVLALEKVMSRLGGYYKCMTPQERDTWIGTVALHSTLVTYWCAREDARGKKITDPYA